MVARRVLVLGNDGLPQQLQSADTTYLTGATGSNGTWRRRDDGVLEQWGEITLVSGAGTITFPTTFAVIEHVDLTVVATGLNASTTMPSAWLSAEPTLTGASVQGTLLSTVLSVLGTALGTFKVRWRAYGT